MQAAVRVETRIEEGQTKHDTLYVAMRCVHSEACGTYYVAYYPTHGRKARPLATFTFNCLAIQDPNAAAALAAADAESARQRRVEEDSARLQRQQAIRELEDKQRRLAEEQAQLDAEKRKLGLEVNPDIKADVKPVSPAKRQRRDGPGSSAGSAIAID